MTATQTTMKSSIKKQSRVWEWSVSENGQHLAGGFCKTKIAAENDSAMWIESTQADRARADGRIAKGELVTIKPEWLDAGDESYNFYAHETQLPGMDQIRLYAHKKQTGERSIGLQSIRINQLSRP